MPEFAVLTPSGQLAAFLRGEILRGRWSGPMPGGNRLAAEFGVGRDTAEMVLQLLEKEGRRRGRWIAGHARTMVERRLRMGFRHFLGRMGLAVPGEVSLVCTDDDPAFAWCKPPGC
jgi:DNA-binding GntR family transcriptional regulator